ncbi:LytR family transcriptional regulator [Streptomyces armeniacus]|uniref:LytR family transcriptional regulator n=1 Tax=Streptomyces armeniacus TaxID=83291 RepID=A0A345XXP5_9ACTN|nr:LytR C-terminal domain-containing protein [Streptomyces armeniacus]AXK36411.1 LytR family transcriptional regulator [Streptomyces armeniacus]
MSMLTPPGMGGQYRIKGDRYPRMRRPRNRRRIVLATVSAAAATGLVGWGTLQLIDVFSGGGGSSAEAAGKHGEDGKECVAQDRKPDDGSASGKTGGKPAGGKSGADVPKPGTIKVNVLNATPRSGLAADTADELKKRGFKVGEVTNAPKSLDKKVKGTGLLMGATGADTAARFKVLGSHLAGADTRYDNRKGADVDLVIGNEFKKLTAEKDAARAMAALADPKPSTSPSC